MSIYKKVIKNISNLFKENKKSIIFSILVSLSGIVYFGNVFGCYKYFIEHRFFISLAKNFKEFFTVIKSFFTNSLFNNSGESITYLFNYNNLIQSSSLSNKILLFNIVLLFITLIIFLVTNISQIFLIYTSKKQNFTNLLKETKKSFKNVILLQLIQAGFTFVIFILLSCIGLIFHLNSILFLIISFTISGLLFLFTFFILQYALRYIIFFNTSLKESLKKGFLMFKNNLRFSFKNLFFLILQGLLMFTIIVLIALPLLLICMYCIDSGFTTVQSVLGIFLKILVYIYIVVFNIYIIKYLNEMFGEIVLKEK